MGGILGGTTIIFGFLYQKTAYPASLVSLETPPQMRGKSLPDKRFLYTYNTMFLLPCQYFF